VNVLSGLLDVSSWYCLVWALHGLDHMCKNPHHDPTEPGDTELETLLETRTGNTAIYTRRTASWQIAQVTPYTAVQGSYKYTRRSTGMSKPRGLAEEMVGSRQYICPRISYLCETRHFLWNAGLVLALLHLTLVIRPQQSRTSKLDDKRRVYLRSSERIWYHRQAMRTRDVMLCVKPKAWILARSKQTQRCPPVINLSSDARDASAGLKLENDALWPQITRQRSSLAFSRRTRFVYPRRVSINAPKHPTERFRCHHHLYLLYS
jgi:hypothetical protein